MYLPRNMARSAGLNAPQEDGIFGVNAMPNGRRRQQGRENMAWKKPRIVEISLALEINSYACAEIA
jgi:coenzyme PQQ precursor peptide PqqA